MNEQETESKHEVETEKKKEDPTTEPLSEKELEGVAGGRLPGSGRRIPSPHRTPWWDV